MEGGKQPTPHNHPLALLLVNLVNPMVERWARSLINMQKAQGQTGLIKQWWGEGGGGRRKKILSPSV